MEEMKHDVLVDAKGLACPMPIVRTKKAMKDIEPGSVVQIQATDKGSTADVKAWAQKAGHDYIGTAEEGDTLKHYLRAARDREEEAPSFPHVIDNEGLQTAIQNSEPMTILDVREKNEHEEFHIPGAQSIPLGELETRIQEVDKEKTVYVVCRTGNRSDLAAHTLSKNGYTQVVNVIPGMSQWKKEGLTALSAKELATKVIQQEPLFILDVRNEDAFQDWKVEGAQFDYLNVPYFDLLDGVEEILPKLPSHQPILVVCAKENSSIMVGEMLVEEGLAVSYLSGGMKAWSEHLEPIKVADLTDGGELYQFVRLGKGCLSYMVISGSEAVVIDSARMTDAYVTLANEKEVSIAHVLDTHLHADHISGGRTLAELTNAKYWLPSKDANGVTFSYESIEDGSHITVGATTIDIQALYTPGHTIGSTSFIIDDVYLLSGDILFIDSIGRPDLAGKAEDWVTDLRNSLYTKYKDLSSELIVLPAHFMNVDELNEDGSVAEKLGVLFEENHGLNVDDKTTFRSMVTDNLPPQPNAYQEIRETNLGVKKPSEEEQREMEVGPNRCAIR